MRKPLLACVCFAAILSIASPVSVFASEEEVQKYLELAANGKSKEEEAKKLGAAILANEKDADQLNEFAWKILTEEGIKDRDLDLGMRVAKAAFDACEGKSAPIVDTYARAFFENGKIKEAIEWQKKAIALCDDDNLKPELEEALKKYEEKAAKPAETK